MTPRFTIDERLQASIDKSGGHNWQKLNEEQAREIRRRALGGERICALAAAFNISRGAVTCIKHGRTWKYLGPPPAATVDGHAAQSAELASATNATRYGGTR